MKTKNFFLIIFSLFTLISCSKDEPNKPDEGNESNGWYVGKWNLTRKGYDTQGFYEGHVIFNKDMTFEQSIHEFKGTYSYDSKENRIMLYPKGYEKNKIYYQILENTDATMKIGINVIKESGDFQHKNMLFYGIKENDE